MVAMRPAQAGSSEKPADEDAWIRRLLVRLAMEMGPLLVFFAANYLLGIFAATVAFMLGTIVAAGVSMRRERRVPVLPLVSTALVLVFGALTLLYEDEIFILVRPTVMNGAFAAVLLGGLVVGRPLLKAAFGDAVALTDRGWHVLSLRLGLFLLFLAALNELVWRSFSVDAWVAFKTFGLVPLNLLFVLSQWPFAARHRLPRATGG